MNSSISSLVVQQDQFKEQNLIGIGAFSSTFLSIQSESNDKYAKKYLNNVSITCNNQQQISFFDSLSKKNYKCFLPPSFISFNQSDGNPIIYTIYAENRSLQYIVEQQTQGKVIPNYDKTQEYLILYGVSFFLESFHNDQKVHGSIKLSNVLLNENLSPFVSDPSLYQIINKPPISSMKNKTIDYLVSLPPEVLNNQQPTQQSDIYSFGILILQILSHKINIFTNDNTNTQQIEMLISNNTEPEIPSFIPPELGSILKLCFSSNPEKRPKATNIKNAFEKILSSERYEKRFNIFKNSLPYQELGSNKDFDLEPIDPKKLRSLWAIDCSETVKENQFYHNELRRIINEYYKSNDEIYLWDNDFKKISYNELNTFISNQQGFYGTKSSLIAEIAHRSSIREHLIIITDGSVDEGEIDRSDQLMRRYRIKFKFVTNFIILDENPPELQNLRRQYNLTEEQINEIRLKCDLSVGAPYSRGCQNATYYIKTAGAREELTSLNHQDISSLKNLNNINSYDQFMQEFDHLDRAIQAITLGKDGNTDPLLYFQIKGGETVNYGISIIIDPCFSKFDHFSNHRTLQTIGVIQSAISKLDISFFDLFVADSQEHEPKLLYTEEGIILAPQAKEKFIESLFQAFQNPVEDADLSTAIDAALDFKLKRKTEYNCIILVLTNRLLETDKRDLIINKICNHKNVAIYGIGYGIYPKNTEKDFPDVSFNPDTSKILKEIAPFYDEHTEIEIEKYDPKTMKTLWAIDSSESVKDNQFYHSELEKIVNEYYKEGDDICLWHNFMRKISKNELNNFIKNRNGFSGTKSSYIAQIACHSSIDEHLLIVTDGTIDYGQIDQSDELVQSLDIHFKYVTVFIIHDENPPLIQHLKNVYKLSDEELENYRTKCDLSVGVPYTRGCQNVTYLIKKEGEREKLSSLNPQDIVALKNIGDINDYNKFSQLFGHLDKAIQNLTIGKEKNKGLSGQLEKLYERVNKCSMNNQQKNDFDKKFNQLKRMADGALRKAYGVKEIDDAKQGST